jgi:prealbumin domain-containing protein
LPLGEHYNVEISSFRLNTIVAELLSSLLYTRECKIYIMSFMKLAAIIIFSISLAIFTLLTSINSFNYAKSTTQNKTSASPSTNDIYGTLIVTNKVINEGGGNKRPSDFTINIHGNDPFPSSFRGSLSGIPVRLHMGMFSVTETRLPGYNSTMSDDCSGGIMSIQTKKCIVTNFYSQLANSRSSNTNMASNVTEIGNKTR